MPFPNYFFKFARLLGQDYWLVLGEGHYGSPTTW
jgi:hypothetical protein